MRKQSGGVGRPVQVTYTGTNPSASAVTIKKQGTNTNDSLAATEHLIITAFEFIAATGGAMLVSGGTGAVIARGTLPTTGGGIAQTGIERRTIIGTPPTVTAAAGGQTDFVADGYIIAAP